MEPDSDAATLVPHYSGLTIHLSTIEEDARSLVSKLRPDYDVTNLKIVHFTEGITNHLIGCFPKDFNPETDSVKDVILIRVYGHKTELFTDRRKEIANMVLIHQHGLSPPVFCSFANGMAYGYSVGKVVNVDMVKEEPIYNLITHKLVKMHSIAFNTSNNNNNPGIYEMKKESSIFRLARKYLSLIAESFQPGDPVDQFLTTEGLTLADLNREVDRLEESLSKTDSPLVFCHNDLLLNNIIYNESRNSISFIDFEYADINYQAFDIANHFNEFAGIKEYDPDLYPSKEFQCKWIACYLKHWDSIVGPSNNPHHQSQPSDNGDHESLTLTPFDQRIENLYIQVEKFSLASKFLWGIWSLLQALHSQIEFNFFDYGAPRIRDYFQTRESILNL